MTGLFVSLFLTTFLKSTFLSLIWCFHSTSLLFRKTSSTLFFPKVKSSNQMELLSFPGAKSSASQPLIWFHHVHWIFSFSSSLVQVFLFLFVCSISSFYLYIDVLTFCFLSDSIFDIHSGIHSFSHNFLCVWSTYDYFPSFKQSPQISHIPTAIS